MSLDPSEKALGKSVEEMTPGELVSYIREAMESLSIDVRVEGAGVRERAVLTALQKTYGKPGAGRIVKWAMTHHEGKDEKGKPITFFSFEKARKWWTDQLYGELQSRANLDVVHADAGSNMLSLTGLQVEPVKPVVDPSTEKMRHRTLGDRQAARLYRDNPKLGHSYEEYCPTCFKDGHYFWKGVKHACDCQLQLQLHKHYLWSGVGVTYQRLGWEDYQGDPEVQSTMAAYVERHANFVGRGVGMILYGTYGVGKTMSTTLLIKDLIKRGYACYSTTFASMVEMYTAGWKSAEDQRMFQDRVVRSDVLLLDDLGREMKTKTKLSETTFDDVLRRRVQEGRPTFITTNMTLPEMSEGYGGAILSLLSENCLKHEMRGEDFRPRSAERLQAEVLSGEIRPIV